MIPEWALVVPGRPISAAPQRLVNWLDSVDGATLNSIRASQSAGEDVSIEEVWVLFRAGVEVGRIAIALAEDEEPFGLS